RQRAHLLRGRGPPLARVPRRRPAPLRPRTRVRHLVRDRQVPADPLRARVVRAAPRRDELVRGEDPQRAGWGTLNACSFTVTGGTGKLVCPCEIRRPAAA